MVGGVFQDSLYAVLRSTGCGDDRVLRAAGGISAGVGVTPLIERCWQPVVEVAKRLYRHGEVRHHDVCAALGLPDDGGPGSVELSLIRSGAVPGSFRVTRPAA